MAHHHKAELKEAEDTLQVMLVQQELLQEQIARQKRKVAALTELANEEEDSGAPVGLVTGVTDAVRTVLMAADKPLNPAQVRSKVEALGLPQQQNLLASVHTVIRRLLESGDIESVGDLSFGGGYRWKKSARFGELGAIDYEAIVSGLKASQDQISKGMEEFVAKMRKADAPALNTMQAIANASKAMDAAALRHIGPATKKLEKE